MDKFPEYLRVAIKLIMKDRDRFYNTFQLWDCDPFDGSKISLSAQESAVLADIIVDSDMLEITGADDLLMIPPIYSGTDNQPFFPQIRKNRKGMKEKRDVLWPEKEVSDNRVKVMLAEFKEYGIFIDEVIAYIDKRDDESITERHMSHLVKTISMLKKGVTWETILDMKNYGKRDD